MNLEGKKTIVAFNSMGFPYAMDTNIKDINEEGNRVVIIHKPKRKRKHFKHTYTKDSELKVYDGWLNLGNLMDDISTSYEPTNKLQSIKKDPLYTY